MENDKYELLQSNKIIKMNNILIRQELRSNVLIQKLFYIIVANSNRIQDHKITLSKSYIRNILNLPNDKNSPNLVRKGLNDLMKNSLLKFDKDDEFTDGFLIPKISGNRKQFDIYILEDFEPLLLEYSQGYTSLLLSDTMKFKSKHTMALYQCLMFLHYNSRDGIQLTTEQLFDIFGLSSTDYHYKGKFMRSHFEEKVLKPAYYEVQASKSINKLRIGKVYDKFNSRLVKYYVFTYEYLAPTLKEPLTKEQELALQEQIDIANTKWTE